MISFRASNLAVRSASGTSRPGFRRLTRLPAEAASTSSWDDSVCNHPANSAVDSRDSSPLRAEDEPEVDRPPRIRHRLLESAMLPSQVIEFHPQGIPIDAGRIDQDLLQVGDLAEERVELLGEPQPLKRPIPVQPAILAEHESIGVLAGHLADVIHPAMVIIQLDHVLDQDGGLRGSPAVIGGELPLERPPARQEPLPTRAVGSGAGRQDRPLGAECDRQEPLQELEADLRDDRLLVAATVEDPGDFLPLLRVQPGPAEGADRDQPIQEFDDAPQTTDDQWAFRHPEGDQDLVQALLGRREVVAEFSEAR